MLGVIVMRFFLSHSISFGVASHLARIQCATAVPQRFMKSVDLWIFLFLVNALALDNFVNLVCTECFVTVFYMISTSVTILMSDKCIQSAPQSWTATH